MTAYRVLKNTEKAGNSIIGVGCYSAVLKQGRPWECKVVKIANTVQDPWLDYYHEVVQSHKDNIHVPAIHKLYVDEESNYYVANMEELSSECWDLEDCDDEWDRYTFAEDVSQVIIGEITEKEFKSAWREYKCVLFPKGFKHFFAVIDTLRDCTDVATDEDIYENCQPPEETRKLDIHAGNIMFRNGAVVITDPWCNLTVDDHPSMETYVEESSMECYA